MATDRQTREVFLLCHPPFHGFAGRLSLFPHPPESDHTLYPLIARVRAPIRPPSQMMEE